ncbi:hypothetical protein SS1G_02938 [Sclerotinia sclerotiorum 1980 UF-70]|uniref:UBC core domain-containing protein n=1 Tax=Sclerotinia sclerotiorum (strain ATCC 18683 / 1980 / Ss-1) TaxID=665079 RepID=A7EC99_SCLS1|nr:hypothetical protein SS1G_02938 [Sclerotinia sclerotiorum 1980 UF-70]EDO00078.1 hypothetical protein SS1G_02938 [Sclerotinia sclerotiorum 1980 UF-70]
MAPQQLSTLPTVRKQNLLVEFSSLKYACPHGVFMSLTPGDPTLWSGVLFVRKDEERLPPGGFSLRDGFPAWFGRRSRRSVEQRTPTKPDGSTAGSITMSSPGSGISSPDKTADGIRVGVYEVLRYLRRTFDDELVLDKVPLEAAGNPGAWHAWKSYRIKIGKMAAENKDTELKDPTSPIVARAPGEWNWDGVWEARVKKGIEASIADTVLYGLGADDLIQFLNFDKEKVEQIREQIKESAHALEPQRRSVA